MRQTSKTVCRSSSCGDRRSVNARPVKANSGSDVTVQGPHLGELLLWQRLNHLAVELENISEVVENVLTGNCMKRLEQLYKHALLLKKRVKKITL